MHFMVEFKEFENEITSGTEYKIYAATLIRFCLLVGGFICQFFFIFGSSSSLA